MDYISQIRHLARSQYWMNIYNSSKEIGSISLFANKNNYSGIQVLFLYWLRVYDLLYSELSSKEWKYLSEEVIENDIRCDAFLYWRGCQRDQELEKSKQTQKKNNLHFKSPGKVTPFDINFEESGK
jgi:hypothetical protein